MTSETDTKTIERITTLRDNLSQNLGEALLACQGNIKGLPPQQQQIVVQVAVAASQLQQALDMHELRKTVDAAKGMAMAASMSGAIPDKLKNLFGGSTPE